MTMTNNSHEIVNDNDALIDNPDGSYASILSTDYRTMAINTFQHSQISTTTTLKQQNQNHIYNPRCSDFTIGIIFVQDNLMVFDKPSSNEVILGTIIINKCTVNARSLRENIQKLFKMDDNYVFLSKLNFPVLIDNEDCTEIGYLINADNIVRFTRRKGLDRYPLIGFHSNGNAMLIGHIVARLDLDLKKIRQIIDEQIEDMTINNIKLNTNYYFYYNFGCIINKSQESAMTLIEIIKNNSILINFEKSSENYPNGYLSKKAIEYTPPMLENQPDSSNKSNQTKSFGLLRRKTTKLPKKEIMISYVRKEAAENAIRLKNSLIDRGYSVYLDVHEINTGSDWQDSLNNAIRNCHIFIPLITPEYGRTQWTNREVKLADTLNKHIIPISFLSLWPPECLAIQFSTTQYIYWNPLYKEHNPGTNDLGEEENEVKLWDEETLKAVTKKIQDNITTLMSKMKPGNGEQLIDDSRLKLTSSSNSSSSNHRKLIVISAHPEQLSISEEIKSYLSHEFEVWCSNDNANISSVDYSQSNYESNSQNRPDQDLTKIDESSTITRPTQDYARKIVSNSKQKSRPKSVPNPEKVEIITNKERLTKVFSHEDSKYSSISPDKMDKLKCFRKKVDESSLVIILASEQYYKSKTSEQHVFYCGERNNTILVQVPTPNPNGTPVWFSKLMSKETPLNYNSETFKEDLLARINLELDPKCKVGNINLSDMKIQGYKDELKKHIPNPETCVFVFGSTDTSKLGAETPKICQEIGKELAKIDNINIVTNGHYGTGDIVAHTFFEERRAKGLKSEDSVYHIVPIHNDGKNVYEQKDKYGQLLLLGDSTKERDSVIARTLNTTIVIGGDESTAREIHEIIWHDLHYVIPIKATGGAAGGMFEVPSKMFLCPNGVKEEHWSILMQEDATPTQIAKAVKDVIKELKTAICEHHIKAKEVRLKRRVALRKKDKSGIRSSATVNTNDKKIEYGTQPASPEKLPVFESNHQESENSINIKEEKLNLKERISSFFRKFTGNQ